MPAGSVFWISAIRAFTRVATSFPFSPWSMMTMPATVSPLPSRVTAPLRGSGPTPTSATSPRRIGHALDRRQHDAPEVLDPGGEAAAAHGEALGTVLDEAAAEGGVVVGHRLHHLVEREAVAVESAGLDDHVVLLREAAPGVDLGDALHRSQPRPHVPVVERLLLHRVRLALDEVLVDLAEGGRHRPERRLEAGRDAGARVGEPLGHELAGEVDRHAVLEDDGDHREPELRERADLRRRPGAPMSAVSIG